MSLETTVCTNGKRVLATVGQVAEYCQISRALVYRLMESGDLPYTRIGARRRIRWEDVEQLEKLNRVGVGEYDI